MKQLLFLLFLSSSLVVKTTEYTNQLSNDDTHLTFIDEYNAVCRSCGCGCKAAVAK